MIPVSIAHSRHNRRSNSSRTSRSARSFFWFCQTRRSESNSPSVRDLGSSGRPVIGCHLWALGMYSDYAALQLGYTGEMDLGLKGKVAMVAAASQGLGFAIAKVLAAEG